MKTIKKTLFLALFLLYVSLPVQAKDFPSKSLTIINPFASGGSSYLQANILSNALKTIFDKRISIVNKPGGGGGVGMLLAKRAKPDGHTIVFTCLGPCSLTPNRSNVGYNTPKDFVAIARVSSMPYAIAVDPDLNINSFEELLEYGRQNPGELSYGTTGAGLMQHMMFESFLKEQHIEMKHIPFTGGAKALSALLGKHINISVQTASEFLPHYEAKTIKVLAVTGEKRYGAYPEVPTMKEMGYSTLVEGTWYGFAAPKKTDPEKIKILESAIKQALEEQDVINSFEKAKIQIDFLPGKELDEIIAQEYSSLEAILNK